MEIFYIWGKKKKKEEEKKEFEGKKISQTFKHHLNILLYVVKKLNLYESRCVCIYIYKRKWKHKKLILLQRPRLMKFPTL